MTPRWKCFWINGYTQNSGTVDITIALFCDNRNKYIFTLSSIAVQQALSLSDSTYRRAKEELLEKSYLIAEDGNKHTLHFYPKPRPTTYERKKKKDGTHDLNMFFA